MINTLSNFLTLNGCYSSPKTNTKKVLSPFEESLDKLMEKVASNFKSKDELVIVHPKKDDIVAEFVNGKEDLVNHLKENNLNFEWKKDYYFLVINKNNNNDIIINSYKGFNNLTPNINNLPFQIKWRNNRDFIYYDIFQIKKKLLQVLQKPKESWKETFLNEIRNIY
jgi:hypothetical protein